MIKTQDLRIMSITPLPSPKDLKKKFPATEKMLESIVSYRNQIQDILSGKDKRFLVVVGPCSIREEEESLDYARRLADIKKKVKENLFIVMRAYFEKPRTIIGWKGIINDPHLDGSSDLDVGLNRVRQIVWQITNLDVPIGTEVLDPFNVRYISDLLSWGCIGARTVESQIHREIASGLSMPVGFKNGTEGSVKVAADAIEAARHPHTFRGINDDGQLSRIDAKGNEWCHIILRGGGGKTNYDEESVSQALAHLSQKAPKAIVVDCSHGNSHKKHEKQGTVFMEVMEQRKKGNASVIGAMLESNINEGRQDIPENLQTIRYGVSVTDACIGWEETERLLLDASAYLSR